MSEPLPLTPEDAIELARETARKAYKDYRRHTRPYRRTFRGIITRKDAERFFVSRARKTARAMEEVAEGLLDDAD